MVLSTRPKPYALPSYSLTADLISFLRCGLQYRYNRIGKLPSSRPIQLWFGEYVHGVMEEAFRRYQAFMSSANQLQPPWDSEVLIEIQDLLKKRLANRGLKPWNLEMEELADRRTSTAIRDLGPHLFPLINQAEVRLYGSRRLPALGQELGFRETDRYEMTGVVDVLTHIELNDPTHANNLIVREVRRQLGEALPSRFEIIVDYKGMRRQGNFQLRNGALWQQYEWQIQTYAELRRKQLDALPVTAGIIIYINELSPSQEDLKAFKNEIVEGTTDVRPDNGSEEESLLKDWAPGKKIPEISIDFRLRRALRIVDVSKKSVEEALSQFDQVVARIETCRGKEFYGTGLVQAWDRNPHNPETCTICDARTFCPDYQTRYAHQQGDLRPKIPGS